MFGFSRLRSKNQAGKRSQQQMMRHHVHYAKNPELYHCNVVHEQMSGMVRWMYEKVDSDESEQNKMNDFEIRYDELQREGQMYIGLVALLWQPRNLVNQQ